MREREPARLRDMLVAGAAVEALLGLNLLLARVELGGWRTPVALGIAGLMAALVIWFFLELSHARASIRLALLVVLFMVFVFVTLVAVDPATRQVPPVLPPGAG